MPLVRRATVASVALGAVLAATSLAPAQTAPRVAILEMSGELLDLSPGGSATTAFRPPFPWLAGGVRPNIANRGVAMVHELFSVAGASTLLHEWESGAGLTSIATLPAARGGGSDLLVDQDGDYIVANGAGLFRVNAQSKTASTLLAGAFVRITHNLPNGGWSALTLGGSLVDVTAGGVVTSIGTPPQPAGVLDLRSDPRTGNLFYADSSIATFDRNTRSFTPMQLPGIAPHALDIDSADGNLVAAGSFAVAKVDRSGAILQTLYRTPMPNGPSNVGLTVVGSRHLVGTSPATAGSVYQLQVSFPLDAGEPYQLAASFGFRPGIPSPAGRIPLVPDALFSLSVSTPQIFQRFAGTLDARGEAGPAIRLPAGTRGVRFYLAAVAVRNGTLSTVSEPLGVTVR